MFVYMFTCRVYKVSYFSTDILKIMHKHVNESDSKDVSERNPVESSAAAWKTPSPVCILQSKTEQSVDSSVICPSV